MFVLLCNFTGYRRYNDTCLVLHAFLNVQSLLCEGTESIKCFGLLFRKTKRTLRLVVYQTFDAETEIHNARSQKTKINDDYSLTKRCACA
jgi:hypothetical protein